MPEQLKTKPTGYIDPERLYTSDGLQKAIGIGHGILDAARASGLKPVRIPFGGGNGRVFYRGSDVIEWIESTAARSATG